jgi:hypothetical protein
VGDFNLIYKDEDKSNSNYNRAMMGHFRKLIDGLWLKEVPLHAQKYTWSNQQEAEILVKLNRVLCSVDWEDLFPSCLLQCVATDDSMAGATRWWDMLHLNLVWPEKCSINWKL